jgi:hypothetical protein
MVGVLRVTVSHMPWPLPWSLPDEVLLQVFGPYGGNKVFVLERTSCMVAYIFFHPDHDACEAQRALHGRCIYDNCCWMDVQMVSRPSTCSSGMYAIYSAILHDLAVRDRPDDDGHDNSCVAHSGSAFGSRPCISSDDLDSILDVHACSVRSHDFVADAHHLTVNQNKNTDQPSDEKIKYSDRPYVTKLYQLTIQRHFNIFTDPLSDASLGCGIVVIRLILFVSFFVLVRCLIKLQ